MYSDACREVVRLPVLATKTAHFTILVIVIFVRIIGIGIVVVIDVVGCCCCLFFWYCFFYFFVVGAGVEVCIGDGMEVLLTLLCDDQSLA